MDEQSNGAELGFRPVQPFGSTRVPGERARVVGTRAQTDGSR
ncbi:hypothetical protein [Streptomyces sp. NPDC059743]